MIDNMKEDVLRVLLSEDEIREKVRELGGKITADYKNSNLMLVTVLKGAVVFLADLMRQIDVPAEIDFMVVSSYGSGVKSSGVVKIVKDLDVPLAGKDILIVEDILDSGLTLSYIKELLEKNLKQAEDRVKKHNIMRFYRRLLMTLIGIVAGIFLLTGAQTLLTGSFEYTTLYNLFSAETEPITWIPETEEESSTQPTETTERETNRKRQPVVTTPETEAAVPLSEILTE